MATPKRGLLFMTTPQLSPLLRSLRGKELIFRRELSAFVDTSEYVFKHAILRDVTYESVLKRYRKLYHAQAATWIIEHGGDRAEEFAGLIAEHYDRAGQGSAAGEWYRRAGDQARAGYSAEAAINYYQKALGLLPQDDQYVAARLEIYDHLGEMLRLEGRYSEAAEIFVSLVGAAEQAGAIDAQVRGWNGLSEVQDSQGNFQASLESAGHAEGIARTALLSAELATALRRKGWELCRLSMPAEALAAGEEGLALSTTSRNLKEMAECLNLLGCVYANLGDFDKATDYLEQTLALERQRGDRWRVANALSNLGVAAQLQGDYPGAIVRLTQTLAQIKHSGNKDLEMTTLGALGTVRVQAGDYRGAEIDLRRTIAWHEAAGRRSFLPYYYSVLAMALLGQGQPEPALVLARQALTPAAMTGYAGDLEVAWLALGLIASRTRTAILLGTVTKDADACFAASLRVCTEAGMEAERAQVLRVWANHPLAQGDPAAGEVMWQEARAIYDKLGMQLQVSRLADLPDRAAALQTLGL